MCLEDFRLARGKEMGQAVTIPTGATFVPMLPANPNRVAVIFTPTVPGSGGALMVSVDSIGAKIVLSSLDTGTTPIKMRIEDYGQIVCSALFSAGNVAGSPWAATEVLSYVNAAPFARMEDRNKV